MSSDVVVLDDDTDMEKEEEKEAATVNDIVVLDDDSEDTEAESAAANTSETSENAVSLPEKKKPVMPPPMHLPRHNLFDRDFSAFLSNDTSAFDPAPAAFVPRHDLFSSVYERPVVPPPLLEDASNLPSTQTAVNIVDEEAERKTSAPNEPSDERKNDKDMEVVITEAEQEWRKQRRRRLGRICKRARGKPSFMKLVRANLEVSDDEEENEEDEDPDSDVVQLSLEQLPKRIRIDLDAELGLKSGGSALLYHHASSPPIASDAMAAGSYGMDSSTRSSAPTPSDEGWYEGTAAASFPEDADYLSPIQQWIRQNIQFFSATKADAVNFSGSRRSAIVRGRVGLRCIHCAQAQGALGSDSTRGGSYPLEAEPKGRLSVMPPGATLYPSSILIAASNYIQKFQQHFSDCLKLSDVGRMQLLSLLEDGTDLPKSMSRRSEGGLSNSLYNLISARRIGLVETEDDGLRFGRDLNCEPLPFNTIRWQVEFEQSSGSGTVGGSADLDTSVSGARLTADPESEAVLAEIVAATDEIGLCRLDDRTLLTDYVFLMMRQMAVCHAVAEDFASRFKKPKRLRIGFAGFCCRWCMDVLAESKERSRSLLDFSCRCFPSASENLTSVITSSFTVHLQKCQRVPSRIKSALLAYKKLHLRQMAQLPYGSQRRYYVMFWSRLRAEDKVDDNVDVMSDPVATPPPDDGNADSPLALDEKMSDAETSDKLVQEEEGENEDVSDDELASSNRSIDLPISEDDETKDLLEELESNWDPAENNHVIVPADRPLVSDYVFLIMRQLKVVFPNEDDIARIRRRISIPGLACMHCLHREQAGVSPSGRSFSSAPDNFHSALNSSLYNHLQICVFVSDNIKRALTNTKRVHSAQCAKIKFGSQRKYFNQLYERLRDLESKGKESIPLDEITAKKTKDAMEQYGFMEVPNPIPAKVVTLCLECRMVPLPFRAPDSVFLGRVPGNGKFSHSQVCKKSSLDLSLTADLLDEIIRSSWNDDIGVLNRSSFQEIIRAAVVDETLSAFLTKGWKHLIHRKRGIETDSPEDDEINPSLLPDLWKAFSSFSAEFTTVEAAFQKFSQEFEGMVDKLQSQPPFLNLLLMISPSLVVPKEHTAVQDETMNESP